MKPERIVSGFLIAFVAAVPAPVAACTRALYVAKDGTVIVGRSMDWGEDMASNMWVLPRGMKRDGRGGTNTVSWESKYGSLIVSAYDIGTAEGMNEKSLPGTSRAADRFVRTSFLLDVLPGVASSTYISGTPQQSFTFQAPMAVLSLMRSVGTPLGFANEEQPLVSSTIWRTVSDSTNRVMIFDSALTSATFWVKLDDQLFTFQDLSDVAPAK